MADPGNGGGVKRFLAMFSSGAAGVGLVLVLIPVLLLYFGLSRLEQVRAVGLPLLAIFGIMILFGTLALVAMLFQSLGLTDNRQPLALPEGSIRAAIALALIVLFAIISIMLFLGMEGKPFRLDNLGAAQRDEVVLKFGGRVAEVVESCATVPADGAACPVTDQRYTVLLRGGPGSDSLDLAKQLLVLVGTLMTSVTSYYFATRGAPTADRGASNGTGAAASPPPPPPSDPEEPEEHVDGCDVAIGTATADEDLPAARGGVAGKEG